MSSTASHSTATATSPAIKGRLTIINSKADMYGNRYWAFIYLCTMTGKTVTGTISGGESNLTSAATYIDKDSPGTVSTDRTEDMPIRQFNRLTKGWAYAGCRPEDQIAPFIDAALRA